MIGKLNGLCFIFSFTKKPNSKNRAINIKLRKYFSLRRNVIILGIIVQFWNKINLFDSIPSFQLLYHILYDLFAVFAIIFILHVLKKTCKSYVSYIVKSLQKTFKIKIWHPQILFRSLMQIYFIFLQNLQLLGKPPPPPPPKNSVYKFCSPAMTKMMYLVSTCI